MTKHYPIKIGLTNLQKIAMDCTDCSFWKAVSLTGFSDFNFVVFSIDVMLRKHIWDFFGIFVYQEAVTALFKSNFFANVWFHREWRRVIFDVAPFVYLGMIAC